MKSIKYYQDNAKSFYDRTIGADMSHIYKKFFAVLPPKAKILDAGCGSGRDSKYFLSLGYEVVAFDGSEEMVKLSTREIGKQTLHLRFEDMNFDCEFDAVWASLSLLHVPYDQMRDVLIKIRCALKFGGIFYASYKYGDYAMKSQERDFYNMTEKTILPYIKGLFEVIEIWESPDTISTIAPSSSKTLLNVLCRK